MSENTNNPPAPVGQNSLLPAAQPKPAPMVSVQSPQDILTEAVKYLSPAQAERVVGAAAEELIRIGSLQKEGQIDADQLRDKLETVSGVIGEHASNPNVRSNAQINHRGTSGTVTVSFETGRPAQPQPSQEPKIQAKGAYFVATACFGDYDHPTVVSLRRFRDCRLMSNTACRRFVGVYYRYGPGLAAVLERFPPLKGPSRIVLAAIARVCDRRIAYKTE
jgi:hypothetical protein